jgi:hypothetical protein
MNASTGNTRRLRFFTFSILLSIVFFAAAFINCGGGTSMSTTTTTQPAPTPPPTTTQPIDVTTYHNDNARTGQNLSETILTTSNVNSTNFGKLAFTISADGKVNAEPLYLANVSIGGLAHNVLYVVSEHGTVYSFDADTGAPLWQISTLQTGETPSDDHGCGQISPEIGITATPVIDRNAGPHGTIYVAAMSKNGSTYHQRLHALDATTGAEEFGGPQEVQASFAGSGDGSSGGTVTFAPGQYAERTGLLLLNGVIYTTWTSHCDFRPYTGWIISYDQNTLARISVLNLTPNGNEGAIWMSGAGPAADSNGNIFVLDGNGVFDGTLNAGGFPAQGDYGNAFLKLSTTNKQLAIADYFEMSNQVQENGSDADLGSGGAMLLPDVTDDAGKTWHLAVGAGKDSNIYLVDRDNMGKFSATTNNIHQQLSGVLGGGIWSMPAYFHNTVYYGAVGNSIKAFSISNAQLSGSPSSQTATAFGYPGATPSISANGASNAILWAVENSGTAVLHAYDATDLTKELYNSNQAASGRDHFGAGNKFITPMIANGKVYVGTPTGVGVFGLLH